MKFATLILLSALAGCSREQATAIGNSAAKSYNESHRDNVIKNWQAKVAPTPACAEFKGRFQMVGSRFDNAANGSFIGEMTKVWEAAKAAGCAASV